MSGERREVATAGIGHDAREKAPVRAAATETLTFEKGHGGFGIHIRGGTDMPFIKTKDVTDPGIFIVHMSETGYALKDGRLKVGLIISLVFFFLAVSVSCFPFLLGFFLFYSLSSHVSFVPFSFFPFL